VKFSNVIMKLLFYLALYKYICLKNITINTEIQLITVFFIFFYDYTLKSCDNYFYLLQ